MKSGLVAIELRKLADALDVQPDAEIEKPTIHFYGYEKNKFLALARMLPRPLKKSVSDPESIRWARVHLQYDSDALCIDCSIPQSLTCELIAPAKPAVYRCDPILSKEEEEVMA